MTIGDVASMFDFPMKGDSVHFEQFLTVKKIKSKYLLVTKAIPRIVYHGFS